MDEMAATKIPAAGVKLVVIRMLKDVRKRMDDLNENLKR